LSSIYIAPKKARKLSKPTNVASGAIYTASLAVSLIYQGIQKYQKSPFPELLKVFLSIAKGQDLNL
jgi:hypothetical protein